MTQFQELLFRDLIREIHNHRRELRNDPLSFFSAIRGAQSSGQLMVFGRAVNGWPPKARPSQLGSPQQTNSLMQQIRGTLRQDRGCPMRWVIDREGDHDYNTRKSAFWRVIRQVTLALEPTAEEQGRWSSFLIWSNLYKVSPFDGGNPGSALKTLQFPFCLQLIEKEISYWAPNRLLFLTGLDWAHPFLQSDGFAYQQHRSGTLVQSIGTLSVSSAGLSIPVVIAPHPRGKPERPLVEEILRAFAVKRAGG